MRLYMRTVMENIQKSEIQKSKLIINQFIVSCSHSFRSPLKSISGLVNLMHYNQEHASQDAGVYLDLIDSTVDKMEHTLDELEYFLENSNRKVKRKTIDCKKFVAGVVNQHKGELKIKGISVDISIEESVPLYADLARLRIILINLFSNAIQFQDRGKESRMIGISMRITDNNCVLAISDNGIGIELRNHRKIFQLFFRATEKSSGTGVGLYVVKELVNKMKGTITVTSTPGKGSTFRINLPNEVPKKMCK